MKERLVEQLRAHLPEAGQLTAWWLGGGGFCFKTSRGTQIFIDPYLSNVVQEIFGQARAFPAPILSDEAEPDFLLVTHSHEDHLDPGAIPVIARRCPQTIFVMPPSAMSRALGWGVPKARIQSLSPGASFQNDEFSVEAVAARHDARLAGWETPDALSFILGIEGQKIFFSGDTEYDSSLRRLKSAQFHSAFLCINGTGGNMNAHEAALLAWQLGVSTLVPMHHLLWEVKEPPAESTLDSKILEQTYRALGGTGKVVHPEVGSAFSLRPAQ